jgi:hypothetical protein
MIKGKTIFFYLILFLTIVIFLVCNDELCYNSKFFYKSAINSKIVNINTFYHHTSQRVDKYYFNKDLYLYLTVDTSYYYADKPIFRIGDSLVKIKNSLDYKVYRNNQLYFEDTNVLCNCYYCI